MGLPPPPSSGSIEEQVLSQHMEDRKAVRHFIDESWPAKEEPDIDMESMVTYLVSTTKEASLLLIAVGAHTMITRNTVSLDPMNPWLAFQHGIQRRQLACHIRGEWDRQVLQQSRDFVDIPEYVVYNMSGDRSIAPELLRFDVDATNVHIVCNDMQIWSHLPRDESLYTALFAGKQQLIGNFVSEMKGHLSLKNDPKIPAQKLEEKVQRVKDFFDQLYKDVSATPVPNSFKWPTLQLQQQSNKQVAAQRYGDTFAGLHGHKANEVHHPWSQMGVKPRSVDIDRKFVWDYVVAKIPSGKYDASLCMFVTRNPGLDPGSP